MTLFRTTRIAHWGLALVAIWLFRGRSVTTADQVLLLVLGYDLLLVAAQQLVQRAGLVRKKE